MSGGIHKLGHFFFFPKYDYTLQKIVRFKYEKFLITLVIALYLSVSSLLIYYRYIMIYPQFPPTQIVLDMLLVFVNQIMCILTLASLIYYDQMWVDFFKTIDVLEKNLKLKFQFYDYKLMVFVIIGKLFLFVLITVYFDMIYGVWVILLYIDVFLSTAYDTICAFLIINVIKFLSLCLAQTKTVLNQTVSNNSLNNVAAKLKSISFMYDDIKSLNKSLELIFGWRILLLSINAGFIILGCSNTIILKVSLNLEQLVIDTSSVINGILSIVSFKVSNNYFDVFSVFNFRLPQFG